MVENVNYIIIPVHPVVCKMCRVQYTVRASDGNLSLKSVQRGRQCLYSGTGIVQLKGLYM